MRERVRDSKRERVRQRERERDFFSSFYTVAITNNPPNGRLNMVRGPQPVRCEERNYVCRFHVTRLAFEVTDTCMFVGFMLRDWHLKLLTHVCDK